MRLSNIRNDWDVIVIGGGITGAGIFAEAVHMGFTTLLLEQRDFAWGTSSRSSKLVHGGLRYLKEGRLNLTRMAVAEREHLLRAAPGLVEPLTFFVPIYSDRGPGKWTIEAGLSIYDLIAGRRAHHYLQAAIVRKNIPYLRKPGLNGAFAFTDAQSDDTRLVMRLITETISGGGCAINDTVVSRVLRDRAGEAAGVAAIDKNSGDTRELQAGCVINATGAWAEQFNGMPSPELHIRPLRGSHLVFSADALPVSDGISFVHPRDNRSVFVIPWEGVSLAGTTDIDHDAPLTREPSITRAEADYLMEGLQYIFPDLPLHTGHCIGAFAGVRPVISRGDKAPSEETREHAVWDDHGLISVTGGKLTTFRRIAWDVLAEAKSYLPGKNGVRHSPSFTPAPIHRRYDHHLSARTLRRLYGRYGTAASHIIDRASPEDLEKIPGTHTLWAELPHAAGHEYIRHLDDLMLRRVRIGIQCPEGGAGLIPRIRQLCEPVLDWDAARWTDEIRRYRECWQAAYAPPASSGKETP